MEIRKFIGIAYFMVSLTTFCIFISRTEFSIQLLAWTSFEYYIQFAPYVISIMLFYCGLYLVRKHPKSNFAMAVFGYTILELMVLDWVSVLPNNLGTTATILFGCCAIVALWIAHANSFSLKRLSLSEILISIFVGGIESAVLFHLNSID